MTALEILAALGRVLGIGLIFGTGIPLLFSLGMRAMTGDPIYDEDGALVGDTDASPQMKALGVAVYVCLSAVVVIAIIWIARETLSHYTGWAPFGDL